MISPELIKKIKKIQLHAKFLVTDQMAGQYTSHFKGRGIEFEEVREYAPGDDVRSIDWNVSARMDKPFIKQFKEERELTILIAVDISRSGQFGTQHDFKNTVMSEVAAALAYFALKSNDKIGLLLFSDQVEAFIPPKKGRAHIWRVIRAILSQEAQKPGTHFAPAFDYLGRVLKRRSVIFLISDFIQQQGLEQINRLANKHQVIPVRVLDRHEKILPDMGLVAFQDLETNQTVWVDTGDAKVRQIFKENQEKQTEQLVQTLKKQKLDLVSLLNEEKFLDPLVRFFKTRK